MWKGLVFQWGIATARHLTCARSSSSDGVVHLSGASAVGLGPWQLPPTLLEERVPFHFEISEDRVSLLAPAPRSAVQRIPELAPSQFQANWKRSGGVIDGGPNAHAWLFELLPQWLDLNATLPPVPQYIQTKYLLEQDQFHLPAYFGMFSLQDLRSLKVPLWEIYSAEFLDMEFFLRNRLDSIVQTHFPTLSSVLSELGSEVVPKAVSLEYAGITGEGLLRVLWEFPPRLEDALCDVVDVPMYQATVTKRESHSTGLTHRLTTEIQLERALESDCEVTLHEFWPAGTFVDSEELKAAHDCTNESGNPPDKIAFGHFSEMELPTHLSTPTILMTRWKGPIAVNSTLTTCPILLHTRYNLPVGLDDTPSELRLPHPVTTVKCHGLVNIASTMMAKGVQDTVLPSLVVTQDPLKMVATLTTLFCGASAVAVTALTLKKVD
eukprot:Protomagalhaensia_wolfi_Nauph_80__5865@NODE_750_length_2032_cov_4_851982_g563_i0_p1_GENE_NODE_750_length_2032_cov_4_851982_g563_i0NODE_750_length_2032_cov_4_851982_g563_i0_p1_ORF_typecomplete_len437_score74_82PIGX/PF08320_12/3e07_NODE_750_length_2032_cov_4_851982_g563_i06321942